MENYNIYDEVGRGAHSFVYKARRKRTIEYVAVKSTTKSRMDKILNEVQLLHKLDSRHVLKFHNWYESKNHLWVITEYCIGGDLLNLITQDKRLPETTIQSFGYELLSGLQYLHSNGILYCDLKPANILIDEFGSLKLADFGLARRIPNKGGTPPKPLGPGSPNYMAPELFQQPPMHSFASDFWAFGCLLYELCVNSQAFYHTDFQALAHIIRTKEIELPVKGVVASEAFWDLISKLLIKNPFDRITWEEVIQHPFWHGLPPLPSVSMPRQDRFDLLREEKAQQEKAIVLSSPEDPPPSDESDMHVESSLSDSYEKVEHPPSSVDERALVEKSKIFQKVRRESRESEQSSESYEEVRPLTAPVSAIQTETIDNQALDAPTKGMKHKKAPHTAPQASTKAFLAPTNDTKRNRSASIVSKPLVRPSRLILTAADTFVQPIIGNEHMRPMQVPDVDTSRLSFTPIPASQLLANTTNDLEKQLKNVYVKLKSPQTSEEEREQVLVYLTTLCSNARLSNVIVNSSILPLLATIIGAYASEGDVDVDAAWTLELVCFVLGLLFRYARRIASMAMNHLKGILESLTSVLRRLDASSSCLVAACACFGEILFYMTTMKEIQVSKTCFNTLVELVGSENHVVGHYACRTLCNVLTQGSEGVVEAIPFVQAVEVVTRQIEEATGSFQVTLRQTLVQILLQTKGIYKSEQEQVLKLITRQNILEHWWKGCQAYKDQELILSSLNLLNTFLDLSINNLPSLEGGKRLLTDKLLSFAKVEQLLQDDEQEAQSDQVLSIQAKALLLLYFGISRSRPFLTACIRNRYLDQVNQLLLKNRREEGETHVVQCAMLVVRASIRMALKLSADCMFSIGGKDTVNQNAVYALPFLQFDLILSNDICRMQLVEYFGENKSGEYTFFLKLMSKLLSTFANERMTATDGQSKVAGSVGTHVSNVLRKVLDVNDDDESNLLEMETEVLYSRLLPALVNHIGDAQDDRSEDESLVNCLHIVYLLLTPGNDIAPSDWDHVVSMQYIPQLFMSVFKRNHGRKRVYFVGGEIFLELFTSNVNLLSGVKDDTIATMAEYTLDAAIGMKNDTAAKMARIIRVLMEARPEAQAVLFTAKNSFFSKLDDLVKDAAERNLPSLLLALVTLLYELCQYYQTESRQENNLLPMHSSGLECVVNVSPTLIQICSRTFEKYTDNSPGKVYKETADLASRCLILLCKMVPQQARVTLFSKCNQNEPEENMDATAKSIGTCLSSDKKFSSLTLHILLIIKYCLRNDKEEITARWLNTHRHIMHDVVRIDQETHDTHASQGQSKLLDHIAKAARTIASMCPSVHTTV